MLPLTVWIAVGVLAVVVLGALASTTAGALARPDREAAGLDRDVRPVRDRLQVTVARSGGPPG